MAAPLGEENKLRSSWKPSSLLTLIDEQLWDQWPEERKVRGKPMTVSKYPFPWGCSTLSYRSSLSFHPVTTSDSSAALGRTALAWWYHAVRVKCLPAALTWHKTPNLGCHFPQIRERQGSREAKGYTRQWAPPGSLCSLVSGGILPDESHSRLRTVIFYTDHAQTREQKRCVCSSSIRNTKTLFWWIICLLRKAQLNCESSNCCEVLQLI